MARLVKGLLQLALIVLIPASAAAAETFRIDPEHTVAVFKVDHLGFSKLPGRFNRLSGRFVYDAEVPERSSVTITIETDSIDTNHQQRDAHLRSPDFFNVLEFPIMTFRSTRVEPAGENTARVTGDFTLLGVTRPLTLAVRLNKVGPNPFKKGALTAGFSAEGTLKRSDFGMRYLLPQIGDEIALSIEAEGQIER